MDSLAPTLADMGRRPTGKLETFLVLLLIALMPSYGGSSEPAEVVDGGVIKIEDPELENCYQVTDELYRGARLEPAGAAVLASLGVRTVVSLRVMPSDWKAIESASLQHFHIPMRAGRPNEDDIVEFLRIATNPSCQPVYVYCNHGSDRTGMMCAVYRIVVCGWSKEEAICEMTQGPFGYHERYWQVVDMVNDLDVDRVMLRAGLIDE
jgi:tyrosine-protein phosphatase SIW14